MTPPDDAAHPRRLLLVVDAPSLLHRNHHARAHTRITDRSGRPVWALHGMLRQIIESIDGFAPDAVLFGLDDRTGSVRRDSYPAYKAGRAEKHPELVEQLERAGALLDALAPRLHLTGEGSVEMLELFVEARDGNLDKGEALVCHVAGVGPDARIVAVERHLTA